MPSSSTSLHTQYGNLHRGCAYYPRSAMLTTPGPLYLLSQLRYAYYPRSAMLTIPGPLCLPSQLRYAYYPTVLTIPLCTYYPKVGRARATLSGYRRPAAVRLGSKPVSTKYKLPCAHEASGSSSTKSPVHQEPRTNWQCYILARPVFYLPPARPVVYSQQVTVGRGGLHSTHCLLPTTYALQCATSTAHCLTT